MTSSSVPDPTSAREAEGTARAEPSEQQIAGYRQRLLALRRSSGLSDGDVRATLAELTTVAADVLRVERVSVWHLSADAQSLECVHAWQRSTGRHSRGGTLTTRDHPRYFAALGQDRVLVVADARRDPRTRELELTQLAPHDIQARLDAPVLLGGRVVGVLCFEHTGSGRTFHFWEELLAANLADLVALVLQVREQGRAQAELQQLRTRVDDLLESRTSSVVRENADLQREVDALHIAAEAMRKSEDERRRLFAASPVPMLLVGRGDLRVLFANDTCAHALRYSTSELLERRVDELFAQKSDLSDLFALLDGSGEADAREIQLRAREGDAFWALLSARRVEFGGQDAVLFGFTDLTNQKAVEHQLRVLAQRDPLTQAYNRHHFWQIASNEMARVKRYQRPLSIAMIDADFFKAVNDRYGHDVGDMVLRSIVDICHQELRTSDVLARYGGEEFVVLLPETPREGAQVVMERLRERIERTPLELEDGREVRVTVSIGLAGLSEADQDLDVLLKRADEALYAAKHRGRNRVELG